ncbi:MAG: C25 family cysteine peptidase [Candidatus Acidiferrum sp.]
MRKSSHIEKRNSAQFAAVCDALLQRGVKVSFRAQGQSMQPNILDNDTVIVAPADQKLQRGDVALTFGEDGFRVHRVRFADGSAGEIVTRGDAGLENDAATRNVLGRVTTTVRNRHEMSFDRPWIPYLHALRTLVHNLRLAVNRRLTPRILGALPALILLQLFVAAAPVKAVAVTLTQTPSVTTVSPSGTITYTNKLTNNSGTASVTKPVITQATPTNTTYLSYTVPAGWSCTTPTVGQTGNVACTDSANLAANASATITITVTVDPGTAGQTVLNGSATVTSTSTLTGTTTATSTVTVLSADLALSQTVSPTLTSPSGTLTFTDIITNNGASTATTPVFTFVIPTYTVYQGVTAAGYTCAGVAVGGTGTLTCTAAANLANAGTATIAVAVTVNAGTAYGTGISGTASVSSTTYDPNSANNSATTTATVGEADLALSQTASPTVTTPSGTLTFTDIITNNGPTSATTPVFTFTIPTNTVYQGVTAAGYTCAGVAVGGTGTLTCTAAANLANAGTATIAISLTVNAGVAFGTGISGTGSVTSMTYDPNTSNNSATSTATVGDADLTMSQTTSVSVVATGVDFTYTEIASNNGPYAVPAGTIVVYQQTPANTTFQSITVDANWTCTTPGVGSSGPIICTYNLGLVNGATTASDPIVITESVNAGTASDTTILNSATVTSQTVDPVPSNNTSVTTVLVEPVADAELALFMTASPTPVFLSSNLAYNIQVQNLGQAAAAAVTVTDTIPTGTTFVSASGSTGWTCTGTATVTCTLSGTMAEASTGTITITVTSPATSGSISNTATVSSSTTDPVLTNNSSTVITVVQPLVCATPGHDGAAGTITGVVNTYYPGVGTITAGKTTSVTLGASSGATTPIGIGDLLLIIQMQDSLLNTTNTGAYGDGTPGDPATGSTNIQSSGQFEYVTATSAVPVGGGALTFQGTGAGGGTLNTYVEAVDNSGTNGQQTYQIIRVPQYTSATLSSGLVPLAWTGSVGGVLAIDVSSQLTLSGTVAADSLGFRGGGGITLQGASSGADTDYVTDSPAALPVLTSGDAPAGSGANSSKGEGIAGAPHWVAPALGSITTSSTAISTGQTVVEGLPNGSFARGAPGNAGGGGTDGDPSKNDYNSGGGAGGNGGAGGLGGYGWNSFVALNSTDGGFGGSAFPASTGAIVMGGGGGAGTTNNGSYYISSTSSAADCGTTCTGIYSSGGMGGGIIIVHTGSVTGTGTITSNGQSTLNTLNDSTGGGGAGGSIIFFANSGTLAGLTVSATGGNGGRAWPIEAPGAFSGQRHGSGGGGGGGVVLLSGTPASANVAGGSNGYTDTVQDSYGATPGQVGISATNLVITETPGTQSGAYCASADLSVTNSGSPNPVLAGPGPGNVITYSQTVTNNGPMDALNAVFSETIPANTTFQSLSFPGGSGWTCTPPAVGGTGKISCTNPDFAKAASTTFTVGVAVNTGVAAGTVITDVDNATSGTNDPNLSNNSATVQTTVGLATTADLSITNAATPNPVVAGNNITYAVVVTNNGAATATTVAFSEAIPANTTFVSVTPSSPTVWTCGVAGGTLTCSDPSFPTSTSYMFSVVVTVNSITASGTVITDTANVSSATTDPNPNNNSATASVVVATSGQADLSITSSPAPNPVTDDNNVTYTQVVTNNGPSASGTATFTDTIPTGTTFVSLSIPSGWSCGTLPAVGGTGTITCTISSLAVNATANFPLVVKASLGDTPGSTITNTANINVPCSSSSDPNCANNSASTTIYVASPTQADLAITKTANPDPVDQGTNLEYTLQVTNNGPAVAQGVTVSDPLPSEVSYLSVSTSQGTCTYTASTTTVSCSLGSVTVGEIVVITINASANTFSSATLATNTATVSATTSDPDPSNNTASFTSTIAAPTAVQLASFRAFPRQGGGVLLEWKTRAEIRNLGFNVYRSDGPSRQRMNPSIIAGSALRIRGAQPQHAAKTYQWFDPSGTPQSTYELEDIDLNGTSTSHGPVSVDTSVAPSSGTVSQPLLLTQLNRAIAQPDALNHRAIVTPMPIVPPTPRGVMPISLDGDAAVKISVQSEGWYQVSQAQLVAAGLNPSADARTLQLYAEGIQQPMLILGNQSGPLGPNDSIEFYGTGIDTPYSGTRVYWLISGAGPSLRIPSIPAASTGNSVPQSFPFTTVLQQRTTYFATLLNGDNNDNFFGAAVTSAPVDQQLTVAHLDPNSPMPITVDITLQGATDQQGHSVSVMFNGASIGEMDFANLSNVTNTFSIVPSLLQDGVNTVTLTALQGDNDVSLVQSIALHYPHTYTADSNWLEASAPAGSTLNVSGFTNQQIQVFDITNPLAISQLSGAVAQENATYGVTFGIPSASGQTRTLLIFSGDQISPPSALAFHAPANLAGQSFGSQMVVITYPDFQSALAPLVSMHQARGQSVQVVTIDEVFDAFNYGERSPYAIRDFLQSTQSNWIRKPQYLLLVGDASLDPRDYLGLGDFDFVPTRIIETAAFKTASDDWFSDFNQTGYATIATGRLPVRTASDAALVVSKIVNFQKNLAGGSPNQQALLIADQNIGADFTSATKFAATDLPSSLQPLEIFADGQDPSVVSQQIFNALNAGPLLVNFSGHGAEEQWSFSDLFDDTSVASLTNSDQLSVYFIMDCLNGFFQDVYATSLGKALLLAPNGGAAAVWASSGFTNQPPQAAMNQALLQILKTNPSISLGSAILQAKIGVTDNDVRRTWILFGDPAMSLQLPSSSATGHAPVGVHPPIVLRP